MLNAERYFLELLHKVMYETATTDEFETFETILQNDKELRCHYLETMRIHAMLRAQGLEERQWREQRLQPTPWRRTLAPWVAAAAAVVAMIGIVVVTQQRVKRTTDEHRWTRMEREPHTKEVERISPRRARSEEGVAAGALECARQSRRFESGSKLPHSTPAPPGQLAAIPVVEPAVSAVAAAKRQPASSEQLVVSSGMGDSPMINHGLEAHATGRVDGKGAVSSLRGEPPLTTYHLPKAASPPSFAAPAAERTISAAGTEPAALAPKQHAALAPQKEEEADMRATQKLAAVMSAAALTGTTALQAVPVVSNVEITQIQHTRRVQITYDLSDADAIMTLAIETNGVAIPDKYITWLSGDVNKKVTTGSGKTIEWNAGADWPENVSDNTKARVTAWSLDNPPQVVVVDLSEGSTAQAYPVAWYPSTDALPGGVTNSIYKSSHMVLKRIKAGYFTMDENPGNPTRLTQDFYIGIYQLTQGQWYYVMGNWPANFADASSRAFRPVEMVSYCNIRESTDNTTNALYSWPNNGHDVHSGSFMGILRARTGGSIRFDLPTEAQWEYACRAGTDGDWNNGSDPALLGRYKENGGFIDVDGVLTDPSTAYPGGRAACPPEIGGTALVGSYLPNAWGLYDMHGNVYEWCLDWYVSSSSLSGGDDPVGPVSGSGRVYRGGSWSLAASNCRSAYRNSFKPSSRANYFGLRVAAAVVTP